jgi:hypothetical protein
MTPAHLAPLGSQQPLQHARAGEGEFQMQLVHAPHQCKIGGRHWTRLVVKTAATDVQHGRPDLWPSKYLFDRFSTVITASDMVVERKLRSVPQSPSPSF